MTRFISPPPPLLPALLAALSLLVLPSILQAEAPMAKTQAPGYYRMMLGQFEVTAPAGRLRRTRCLAAAQRLRCRNPNPLGPPLHRQSPQNPHLGQRLSDQHRSETDLDRRRRRQRLRPRAGQPAQEPQGSRLPARPGRCRPADASPSRPRGRPAGPRRQAGLPQGHRSTSRSPKATIGSPRPTPKKPRPNTASISKGP